MASNSNSSCCYIYHDCAWIHTSTAERRVELYHTSPYKVVAYSPDGRMVPLCLEDPSEMQAATAHSEGHKFTGTLVKYGNETVTLRKSDGKYLKVEYEALELAGDPNTTVVKWACDFPVELRYRTGAVKWVNIVEVNACTNGPSTISDTALIDSDLPYRFEGNVTLIKRENVNDQEFNESPLTMAPVQLTRSTAHNETRVAFNTEVHKSLGYIALPSLMKVELSSSPFHYDMIYGINLNGGPKKGNAVIQLESTAPWYIQPAKCNLQFGNYHCCYQLPSTPKGERLSFPVAKSPEVYYATSVVYNKRKEGDNFFYEVTLEVTVEDSTGDRDKHFIFELNLGQYQVVSVQPSATVGLQSPGCLRWKASSNAGQFRTSFNLVLSSDSSYFNL